MPEEKSNSIWVSTSESFGMRGDHFQKLEVEEFAVNVNVFLEQLGTVLEKAPEKMGKF